MIISPTSYKKNGEEWAAKNPVGTGPFEFVSWEKEVSTVYKKFPDYWQKGKPYLDELEYDFIFRSPDTGVQSEKRGTKHGYTPGRDKSGRFGKGRICDDPYQRRVRGNFPCPGLWPIPILLLQKLRYGRPLPMQ